MDVNKTRYNRLKKRVSKGKERVYNFDQTIGNVMNSLLPRKQQERKGSNNDESIQKLQEDYNNKVSKLNNRLSEAEKEKQASTKEYDNLIKKLEERVESGDKTNMDISNNLKDAMNKIYKDREKQAAAARKTSNPSAPTEQQEEETEQPELSTPPINAEANETNVTTDNSSSSNDSNNTSTESGESSVSSAIKKSVNIGEYVKVGKYKYRVTNTFGIRTGANSVPGREGRHSGGLDLVGYDENGNKANLPISLTEGTIVGITRDGDGSVIDPTEGAAGGYIMRVRLPNGKDISYMHLGKDVMDQKADLLGKKVKRGDLLFQGDHSIGSGSMTGPHVKVRVSSVDENNMLQYDHKEEENNPTSYLLYGKNEV
jgi:hypothetical protein